MTDVEARQNYVKQFVIVILTRYLLKLASRVKRFSSIIYFKFATPVNF